VAPIVLPLINMMILTLKLNPCPHQAQAILDVLKATRAGIEGSMGCLEFGLTAEVLPHGGILLLERWESEDDLKRHLQSDGFRKILELMELSQEAPELHVFRVEEVHGFETVEATRAGLRSPVPAPP
jgi:quinol monooxygenase YgiN